MPQITLSGIIKSEYSDNWETIKLVQEDGYKIDLVARFKEAIESYSGNAVQVSYYLSSEPCTKSQMVEGWLKTLYGVIEAEYEANSYRYSSWTSGTDYDTVLKVGGHSLLYELKNEEGKFLIIELNFKDSIQPTK